MVLLVAAFNVARPDPLPPPALPPTFDKAAALRLTRELSRLYPDRSPGSPGALGAAQWFSHQLALYGFRPETDSFSATIPGRGRVLLRNVLAVTPGRTTRTIVAMAHRDDTGAGPGANDNASGTAALVELARGYATSAAAASAGANPQHTLVFLSTDGGAFGGLGAAHFARRSPYRRRIVAVVNLDALASHGPARLELAGDDPRSPAPTLVETAAARLADETGEQPGRTSFLGQLIDLALPFSLYEQAPFLAHGMSAVTLTTAGDRPPPSFPDTPERLDGARLGQMGRAAQNLLGSLDEGLELDRGTSSYVYLGRRLVRGWAIELALVGMLLPFLIPTVDLFARCRRRQIPLGPALRSYRSRLAFWLWAGGLFELFALLGVWPRGAARPLNPETPTAGDWPRVGLLGLAALVLVSWFVPRDRLVPRRRVTPEQKLAGYTAALLTLAVVALVVVATNPFALLFLLPSLHAWLWLPQADDRGGGTRAALLLAGLAGPLLLLGSFAFRFGLGLDAPWYLAELTAIDFVPVLALVVFLAWFAGAAQLIALTLGRYAPYPSAAERPPRGPIRNAVRALVLAARARKREGEPEQRALRS